jgi:SsrA-binding protein
MAKNSQAKEQEGPKTIVNRKARHDYELMDSWEAGISLQGSEVKSVFLGRVNMTDAYCQIVGTELFLVNLDVEPYTHSSVFQPERRRDRKLLLHRKEIDTIQRKAQEKGLTIIPTKIYFKNGRVKVEVALARGRREYDKRDKIQADETRREAQAARAMR